MSDRAIELFIRMHLEKTPRVMDRQRGRQNLTGDVIIAAMGAVQHQRPVGSDLIMARWLDDTSAALRVEKWLEKEAVQYEVIRTDLLIHLVPVALLIFLGKPTDDQIRKLSSLWRKSSERGRRSRRLMKQYLSHIESLEREKFRYEVSPSRETVINDEIDRYTLLIENEKQRINDWATTQARKSYQCPNCHGAGATSKSVVCPECGGSGKFVPSADNARKHLNANGVNIPERVWNRQIKPVFDEILSRLHQEHDETARLLGQRLNEEKSACL